MKNRLLFIFLSVLLMIWSCQNEEDFEEINDVDTTTKNSTFTSLAARISKNPTAFDDFIDQNPATRIEFPFSVTLNNATTISLNTDADYEILIQALENTAIQDDIQIDFPANVSLPNYQTLTVNDFEELQNINWNSFNTSEINCFNIDYPIEIYTYNNLNVEQDEIDINSDNQLFNFLIDLPVDDFFYQIEYPIDVIVDNQAIEINNATVFEDQINSLPQSCFDPLLFNNQPSEGGGDDDLDAFTTFITDGTFIVSFLTDDGQEINEFANIFFQFGSDNSILIDDQDVDDEFDVVGQWTATIDDGEITFDLDFDDSDFGEMDDDWQVEDFSDGVTLSLIDESSDGDTDELVMNKL